MNCGRCAFRLLCLMVVVAPQGVLMNHSHCSHWLLCCMYIIWFELGSSAFKVGGMFLLTLFDIWLDEW